MGFAATAASAGASILGGISGYQQGKSQAAQAAAQQRAAQVQALEVEASRRDELQRTLSSFSAARGANNLTLTSPTAMAYMTDLRTIARRDYLNDAEAIRQQAAAYGRTAQASRSGAAMSLVTGTLNAAAPLGTLYQTLRNP